MELTIEQLIKIILGVLVAVAVIAAIGFFFKNQFFDFLKNLPGNQTKIILGVLK